MKGLHKRYFGSRRILLFVFTIGLALAFSLCLHSVFAAPNYEINYQGKLTDDAGATVADGTYNIAFNLYTVASNGTPLWTSTTTVAITNGLFSYMLGSDDAIDGVDFNQTLYLGVNIGGSGAPSWDGEMSPRKVFGTVPSAFEADNAQTVGGVASTSFLRSDQGDVASGLLTFTGGFISNSSSTITDLTTLTATTTNLVINSERFTSLTGAGLTNTGNVLTLDTTYLNTLYASTTDFDSCSELAAIVGDTTGSCGSFVLSASPTFTGTVNASVLTLSDQLLASNGTFGEPSISFASDTDTGFYRSAANEITIALGAAGYWEFNTSYMGGSSVSSGVLRNSNSASFPGLTFNGSTDTGLFTPGPGSALGFTVAGGEKMRINSSGNIGIGTTSPASLLDVWGDFRVGTSSYPLLLANTAQSQLTITGNTILAGNAYYPSNANLGSNPFGGQLASVDYVNSRDTSAVANGNLTHIDSDDQGDQARGVWGDGKFVYLANLTGGLHTYAISATGSLIHIDSDDQGGAANDIWGDGNFLYLANTGSGISTYSADAQGTLAFIDSDYQSDAAYSVWGDGKFVYLANGGGGLLSYSVDNDGVLTLVDSNDQGDNASGVWGDGEFIYLANQSGGLHTYSVDSSGMLTHIDSDDQGDTAFNVWGDGKFIYLANYSGGLHTYSVDSSGMLTHIDSDDQGGNAYDVWGDGKFVYLANDTGGLLTYSVDENGMLTFIDSDDQGDNAYGVWGDGKFVYLANFNGGLHTYSVDNAYEYNKGLATHSFVGNLGIGSSTPAQALSVVGNLSLSGFFYDADYSIGTPGMVLQTTATGTRWVATSSLNISGGGSSITFGTDNQIPYMNGVGTDYEYSANLTFDGSLLTVGGTGISLSGSAANIALGSNYLSGDGGDEGIYINDSGWVGVGTSTPTERFSVNGGSVGQANINISSNTYGGFISSSGGSNSNHIFLRPGSGSVRLTDGATAYELNIFDGGTNAITFNSNGNSYITGGNVGIGTTTPEEELEVVGNVLVQNTGRYMARNSSNAIGSVFFAGADNIIRFGDVDDVFGRIDFEYGGNPLLTLNNDRVGINDFSPDFRFEIAGTNGSGYFAISSTEAANGDILTVNASGNLGIGSTTPAQKLSVSGNLALSGLFYDADYSIGTPGMLLQTTATGTRWVATSSLNISGGGSSLWTESGSDIYFNTGNVAIGNTTPGVARLSVYDAGTDAGRHFLTLIRGSDGDAESRASVLRMGGPTTDKQWDIAATSSNVWMNTPNFFISRSDNAPTVKDFMINNNGYVGLGVSTPATAFHIDTSDTSYYFDGYNVGNPSSYTPMSSASAVLSLVADNSDAGVHFRNNNTGVDWSIFTDLTNSDNLTVARESAVALTIDASGNLGIGTTTPSTKLDVWGDLRVGTSSIPILSVDTSLDKVGIGPLGIDDGKLTISSDALDEAYIALNPGGAATNDIMGVRVTESGNNTTKLHFGKEFTNQSEFQDLLTIDTSGNIGIGTTSPAEKLHIDANAGSTILLGSNVTNGYKVRANVSDAVNGGLLLEFNDGTDLARFVEDSGDSYAAFYTNGGAERMRILGDGNIGIGVTDPDKRLEVFETVADAQFKISYDATRFAQFQVDSVGDMIMTTYGQDVRITDDNLWICESDSCPAITASSTAGYAVVENGIYFGNGMKIDQITGTTTELGVYNASGSVIIIFDGVD